MQQLINRKSYAQYNVYTLHLKAVFLLCFIFCFSVGFSAVNVLFLTEKKNLRVIWFACYLLLYRDWVDMTAWRKANENDCMSMCVCAFAILLWTIVFLMSYCLSYFARVNEEVEENVKFILLTLKNMVRCLQKHDLLTPLHLRLNWKHAIENMIALPLYQKLP